MHKLAPKVLDLTQDTYLDASSGSIAKRKNIMNLVHAGQERLKEVKQEKTEIMDDLEDQEATTQLTALMLDKWQSYADELKKQIRHSGAEPLGWEDFKRGVRVC